jgi:type VI secretion system protein ImpK
MRARLSMQEALQSASDSAAGSSNPLIAEASALMILLGRLRTGLVTLEIGPLMNHVDRDLRGYPDRLRARGVGEQDARDALFALSALADDIVQNLRSPDIGYWINQPMVARFFGTRNAGVEFFNLVQQALRSPGQRLHLLEVLHTCLSLGFEGQYRAIPGGGERLMQERRAIYATLRSVTRRPDDDLSPRWKPVAVDAKRRGLRVPFIAIAGVAATLVVGTVAAATWVNARDGLDLSNQLEDLHRLSGNRNLTEVNIVPLDFDALRSAAPAATAPPASTASSQFLTLQERLAPQIDAGEVTLVREGRYIKLRLLGANFSTGSTQVEPGFDALASVVANALNEEEGPIQVTGFTDNVGAELSNQALSEARAESVRSVLANHIEDTDRMTVLGRGEADELESNTTAAGRAANRRVEVWIVREDRL